MDADGYLRMVCGNYVPAGRRIRSSNRVIARVAALIRTYGAEVSCAGGRIRGDVNHGLNLDCISITFDRVMLEGGDRIPRVAVMRRCESEYRWQEPLEISALMPKECESKQD